jgi:hypothetical protein
MWLKKLRMDRYPLMDVHDPQGRWPQRHVAPLEQVRPQRWQFHMTCGRCECGWISRSARVSVLEGNSWFWSWFDPESGLDLERC